MRRRSGALLVVALLGAAVGATALQRHRLRWIDTLTNRIPAHHVHWRERGRPDPDAVLYVAIGDSAALGIGASQPDHGYVGLIAEEIGRITGRRVRVRNLSIDGATLAVCLGEELPRLKGLHPVVCTLDIGANDIWSFERERFRTEFTRICRALPPGTVVADLPSFSFVPIAGRVAAANRIIAEVASEHGLWVAPLNATTALGGPISAISDAAGDLFHPNDRGHRRWADAFLPGVRAALARAEADRPTSPRAPSA